MNCPEFSTLTVFKDVVLILTSLSTITFAFLGYTRWKKELTGRVKHEFYRRLLNRMYQYKNALSVLRSTLFLNTELVGNDDLDSEWKVIENRLKTFYPVYNQLLECRPEFEIEFQDDKRLMKLFFDLLYTTRTYNFAINEYFQIKDSTNNKERLQELRGVLFATGGETNVFSAEFNRLFDELETEIKTLLKKY